MLCNQTTRGDKIEKTNSYTYFDIKSNNVTGQPSLARENGIFDADEITKMLDIQPVSSWSHGDKRKDGSTYLFFNWSAEESNVARFDIEAQCLETICNLKYKIPILNKIKEQFDVNFMIMVVPSVYGGEKPQISFNKEIIEFCYLTETTIGVDFYIYPEQYPPLCTPIN